MLDALTSFCLTHNMNVAGGRNKARAESVKK